jgi:osmotically-inducible protein OsmY
MLTTFQKTDVEIEAQIREELQWDCRTEGADLGVNVAEGLVTLSGQVKNYAIKCAAEEAVRRIAGVQVVRNNIKVKIPFNAWKADIEIAEAAAYLFDWNVLIPREQVGALVEGGWVTLIGRVDCWSQREEVERAVSHLAGVLGVINRIRVNAAEVESQKVCESIEATLERYSPQEAQQVHIEMEEGTVRLSGQVPNWGERYAVRQAVGFAPGVRQVVDELKVAIGA